MYLCLNQYKLYQENGDVNCTEFFDATTNAAEYMGDIQIDNFSFIGDMVCLKEHLVGGNSLNHIVTNFQLK
jgi:hypothetical protein